MSYQRCPLCKGKGTIKKENCPVCNGEKIICKKTGLPPSKYVYPYIPTFPIYPTYPTYPSIPEPPYYYYSPTTMFTEGELKSIDQAITNLIFN